VSSRTLKIVLGVSVALNVFALAAAATVLVRQGQVEQRIEAAHRHGRERPPMLAVIENLDPPVRERARETLRASALTARPDFEEARGKRREAIALARSDHFDPARARTLLDESRAAELRGRARLESDAVGLLESLEPDDRAALAQVLTRRGRSAVRGPRETRREHDAAS
jgi:uncharacterized membrane protein